MLFSVKKIISVTSFQTWPQVIKVIGYEASQGSLFYVLVCFLRLDRAQNTTVVLLRTEEPTNSNVLVR